jgi:acetoin utilization deacetylase AcuC-like enzyme
VKIFYATPNVQQLPPGHRFPMGKYELLRARLAAELPQLHAELAQPATDGELALVHTPAYV